MEKSKSATSIGKGSIKSNKGSNKGGEMRRSLTESKIQQAVLKKKMELAIADSGLEMTTSKDVLEALAGGAGPKRVLVTLGYSGWQAGQLEDELGRNGWLTVDADPAVIFDTPVEQRYERALAQLGIDPRMLSPEAGHA